MEIYKLINCKYNDLIIAIFLFISIILGRDTLLTNVIFGVNKSQLIFTAIYATLVIIFLITNRKKTRDLLKDFRIKFMLLIFISILLPMIIKKDFTLMYFSIISCISLGFFLSFITETNKILRYYVNIMIFLCVYSLIANYLLRKLIFSNIHFFQIVINSAGTKFINLGLTFLVNSESYIRNFSVFREPGVFQFFITLALLIEIFISKRDKKIQMLFIAILSLTMITTFSTNGLIQLILIYILLVFKYNKIIFNNHIKTILFIGVIILISICFYFIILSNKNIYWTINSAITKLFTSNDSLTSRTNSININFKLFAFSPIIGNSIKTVLFAVKDNTSSTLILLAVMGIGYGLINIVCWLGFAYICNPVTKFKFINIFLIVIILIITLMSINVQNLTVNNIFYIIPILSTVSSFNYFKIYRINKVEI